MTRFSTRSAAPAGAVAPNSINPANRYRNRRVIARPPREFRQMFSCDIGGFAVSGWIIAARCDESARSGRLCNRLRQGEALVAVGRDFVAFSPVAADPFRVQIRQEGARLAWDIGA